MIILPHDKEQDQGIAHQIFEDLKNNGHPNIHVLTHLLRFSFVVCFSPFFIYLIIRKLK